MGHHQHVMLISDDVQHGLQCQPTAHPSEGGANQVWAQLS